MPTKRSKNDASSLPMPDKAEAPPVPPIHDLDDAEESWQGARIEQFTDAQGNPGPAVASAGESLPAPQGSPVMLASIAIYREPDGRLSLVREQVPQAFYTAASDLFEEVKADLAARLAAVARKV